MQQVPEPVKAERLARLQALIERSQAAFNAAMLGRDMDVLLERPGTREGQLVGRSPFMQAVQVDAPQSMLGSLVSVLIERIGSHSLFGALIEAGSRRAIA
jgi:tRNA-2-methylthio-N6-dimethylallyladenosine synthase